MKTWTPGVAGAWALGCIGVATQSTNTAAVKGTPGRRGQILRHRQFLYGYAVLVGEGRTHSTGQGLRNGELRVEHAKDSGVSRESTTSHWPSRSQVS